VGQVAVHVYLSLVFLQPSGDQRQLSEGHDGCSTRFTLGECSGACGDRLSAVLEAACIRLAR
jgi:hypothetical protein